MTYWKSISLVALREIKMLQRSRSLWGAGFLLFAVAWLPPILLSLRTGNIGMAGFEDAFLLAITLQAVLLPLLALLAGADLFAHEWESGTLIPVASLPIPRQALFIGKILGRMSLLLVVYLTATFSSILTVGILNGFDGVEGALAAMGFGFLLCLACGGVGTALGLWGRERVRAFSVALVTWVLFVFLMDAVLLSGVILVTPGPPVDAGSHGYGDAAPVHTAGDDGCPLGNGDDSETAKSIFLEEPHPSALSAWLMILDPVDLYRFSVLSTDASSRSKLSMALPGSGGWNAWLPMTVGWLIWIVLPAWAGRKWFQKAEWK